MEKIVDKGGRPTKYSIEVAKKVCEAISVSNCGIRKLCKMRPDFPHDTVIFDWIRINNEFSDMYANARRSQAEVFAEGIIDIADDASEDYIVDDEGKKSPNAAAVARAKLMIDTRKWIACKLIPRLYGDKVQQEITLNEKDSVDTLRKDLDSCILKQKN